ncbi:hypothetical protein M758_8G077800 [Ceratodon purpureus]|nr:hypothetical protein M758_8G077800 [Ceratodon purpureus]
MLKLETLHLRECRRLHTMCEFDTKMHHLHTLDLNRCWNLRSFKSLGNLYRLRILNLRGCFKLHMPNLAESVVQLHELQLLNLRKCGESDAFSESLGNLVQLQVLHLEGVASVPEYVGNLTQLKELYVEE